MLPLGYLISPVAEIGPLVPQQPEREDADDGLEREGPEEEELRLLLHRGGERRDVLWTILFRALATRWGVRAFYAATYLPLSF